MVAEARDVIVRGSMNNFDPRNPMGYAFYQIFAEKDRGRNQRPPGCAGWLAILFLLVLFSVIVH